MASTATLMTTEQYETFAVGVEGNGWELWDGVLVEKPEMSVDHSRVIRRLVRQLAVQLDPNEFEIDANLARVRRGNASYFIPDVSVLPIGLVDRQPRGPTALEVYTSPLPLVVEVWSPSTGGYDLATKLPEYQRRGDQEIWRLHPYDRTLTAWRRLPGGAYEEAETRGGTVEPVALPGVTIDLDALFV